MSVVNISGGTIEGVSRFIMDGTNQLAEHIMQGQVRHSTETVKGSSSAFPSTYAFGEVWEMRYTSAFTASQFQGMFLRVAAATGVANTSTIRAAEMDARNASGSNVGELTGVHATINVLGTATITSAYGLHAQISLRSDIASTITLGAVIRAKWQTEDAATITEGYGVLVENEFITGGKALTAAYGVKSTGAGAFTSLIDAVSAQMVETNSGAEIVLIKFQGANGTTYYMVHDTGAATVVAVVTSLS